MLMMMTNDDVARFQMMPHKSDTCILILRMLKSLAKFTPRLVLTVIKGE